MVNWNAVGVFVCTYSAGWLAFEVPSRLGLLPVVVILAVMSTIFLWRWVQPD
jgi:hypothetical protein